MPTHAATHRALKKHMHGLLLDDDFGGAMAAMADLPLRRAVNPLFAFFCSDTPLLRWRAVSAMGVVVSRLADGHMESARVIMRRLMWTLNDESGGIGWGAPEALGEITARHAALADEFAHLLVAYIRPDGNFLEHPILQRGLLWGLGRLAYARPAKAVAARPYVKPFLVSSDAWHRGLAAWFVRAYDPAAADPALEPLADDQARFTFYHDGGLSDIVVAEAALGNLPPLRHAEGGRQKR